MTEKLIFTKEAPIVEQKAISCSSPSPATYSS